MKWPKPKAAVAGLVSAASVGILGIQLLGFCGMDGSQSLVSWLGLMDYWDKLPNGPGQRDMWIKKHQTYHLEPLNGCGEKICGQWAHKLSHFWGKWWDVTVHHWQERLNWLELTDTFCQITLPQLFTVQTFTKRSIEGIQARIFLAQSGGTFYQPSNIKYRYAVSFSKVEDPPKP